MIDPRPEGLVWLDGGWVDASDARVPLADRGVQSGMGVFETLAVRRGRPVELPEHLARLVRSASALSVPLPAEEELRLAVEGAAVRISSGHGWVKIVALRGPTVAVFGAASPPEEEGSPCRAVIVPWIRHRRDPLAAIKSTSYAALLRGAEWARERGADEGLWRNDRGHLTEGCRSNLFAIRGRSLWTPGPREGILEGITRRKAIDAARSLGLTVHEGKLRVERLLGAGEAFLTSSVRGVQPLVAVNGRAIGDGRPGCWTRAISDATAVRRGVRSSDEAVLGSQLGGVK